MKCHEIDYKIYGSELQLLEVELDKGETVVAEAGSMNWMEYGISYETKMGDGSNPQEGFLGRLVGAAKRSLMGESVFLTHFTNALDGKRKVTFSAPYPGKIVPINLSKVGGKLICQKSAFLCAAFGTKLDMTFTKRLGAGFFGGEGFILQKISGDGKAFLHAGGTVVERTLNNETLTIDTGCIVAFTEGLDYDIQTVSGLKSMLFGGEGIFLATLKGTGKVLLQSMPFSRLANVIISKIPQRSN
jgi:uncharacterized protein (TIGR00266 family)